MIADRLAVAYDTANDRSGVTTSLPGVEKMVFKALVFYGFLKTKKSQKVGFFCFFMVF